MGRPPEVKVDAHGRQVLALDERGERFMQYVECSEGCGYLIGCGDAVDTIAHESCLLAASTPPETPHG